MLQSHLLVLKHEVFAIVMLARVAASIAPFGIETTPSYSFLIRKGKLQSHLLVLKLFHVRKVQFHQGLASIAPFGIETEF